MTNYEEYTKQFNKLSLHNLDIGNCMKSLYSEVAYIPESKMAISIATADFMKGIKKSEKELNKYISKRKKIAEKYKKSTESLNILLSNLHTMGFKDVKEVNTHKEVVNNELKLLLVFKEIDYKYYLISSDEEVVNLEDVLDIVGKVVLEIIAENKFKPYRRI